MPLSYQQAGLVLKRPGTGASDLADPRSAAAPARAGLSQARHRRGFRRGTESAVKGLQHDLLPVIGPTW